MPRPYPQCSTAPPARNPPPRKSGPRVYVHLPRRVDPAGARPYAGPSGRRRGGGPGQSAGTGWAMGEAARFGTKLAGAVAANRSLVCVGLDPDPARLPRPLADEADVAAAVVRFNREIVAATSDLVCAYKPNLGFYLALGLPGLAALVETRRLIPPHIPAILDAKIGDIGSTAAAYARGVFEAWDFDAVTVNPYLGADALAPFLEAPGRGVFVLCRTSNPGAADLQDLPVAGTPRPQPDRGALGADRDGPDPRQAGADADPATGTAAGDANGRAPWRHAEPAVADATPAPLYLAVADRIAAWADVAAADVGLVVGATYPAELRRVRARCPHLPILLPGVGAQAGDLPAAVRAGLAVDGAGLLVSASRSVLYAGAGPDFAAAARAAALSLRAEIDGALTPLPPLPPRRERA